MIIEKRKQHFDWVAFKLLVPQRSEPSVAGCLSLRYSKVASAMVTLRVDESIMVQFKEK